MHVVMLRYVTATYPGGFVDHVVAELRLISSG